MNFPALSISPWNAKPPLQIEENQNEAFVGIAVFLQGRYPEGCIAEGPVRASLGMDYSETTWSEGCKPVDVPGLF